MDARLSTVESLSDAYFAPLGHVFRRFGDIYQPASFTLQDAIGDIRVACEEGIYPELDYSILEDLVASMTAYATERVRMRDLDHLKASNGSSDQSWSNLHSVQDIVCLLLYTAEFAEGDSLYKVMNAKLSNPNRLLIKPFVRYIWLLLQATTKCPVSSFRTVYRGIKGLNLMAQYPKDKEFEWHQFCSSSCDIEVQSQFTGTSGPRTMFIIELRSGRGRDISGYSTIAEENEVLLPPNTKFRVINGFDAGNGLQIIQLLEIDATDPILVYRPERAEEALPVNPTAVEPVGHSVVPLAISESVTVTNTSVDNSVRLKCTEVDVNVVADWFAQIRCDVINSVALLQTYAESASASAASNLARAYWAICMYKGYGRVRKSPSTAAKFGKESIIWLKERASTGCMYGQYGLSCFCRLGIAIPSNAEDSIRWLQLAAEQGFAVAQCSLGNRYLLGSGVSQDHFLAFTWYQKAAEQGYAIAQYNLGKRYSNGVGVEKDMTAAVRLYRLAADQGYAAAQFSLANCYYYGEGIAKDKEEATRWYRLATDQGYIKLNMGRECAIM